MTKHEQCKLERFPLHLTLQIRTLFSKFELQVLSLLFRSQGGWRCKLVPTFLQPTKFALQFQARLQSKRTPHCKLKLSLVQPTGLYVDRALQEKRTTRYVNGSAGEPSYSRSLFSHENNTRLSHPQKPRAKNERGGPERH